LIDEKMGSTMLLIGLVVLCDLLDAGRTGHEAHEHE
jgi:hypothetical protein